MKKIFAFLLALVMIISVFSACGNDAPDDTTVPAATEGGNIEEETTENSTNTSTSDTSEPAVQPEDLFDTPESFNIEISGYALNVEISRPQKSMSGSLDVEKSQYLRMYLSDKLGVAPTLTTDYLRVEDSEKFEIIIGPTDHPETEALLDVMSYGDYAVRAVGNKIIVMAFSQDGYDKAMLHLTQTLLNGINKTEKKITVNTAELNKTESCGDQLTYLPTYDGGKFIAAYDAGRVTATTDCDEIIIGSTNAEEYEKYIEKLTAKGYTEYSSNEMGGNKFAIYTNSEYTVNVGYYKNEKEARILIEPKGALPTRSEDNKTTKVTTAQITLLGGEDFVELPGNSLGLIARLEDGRFIVVDGGLGSNSNAEYPKNFINVLKTQSASYTENPVIAAWIITHPHGDHTRLLYTDYKAIKNAGITVESIIANELSAYEVNRAIDYAAAINKPSVYEFPESDYGYSTKKIIETIAPELGADLYKAHIGQTFYLSNCKMEVMYTMEGYAPNICNTQNTTSVVVKMTFTDTASGKVTSLLSTGDASGFSMGVANNFFGSYLASDILTVCHHGANTWGDDASMVAAYKNINAALLLWPTAERYYEPSLKVAQNAPLFKTSGYKESYYPGKIGQGIVVPLPYEVGNVKTGKLY